ncbi:MAG: hypothetical protein J1E40_08545, partial [Oscillospiraceae bacterium]|nr:hypothetical protein [Oscillospiraceae bacterium]
LKFMEVKTFHHTLIIGETVNDSTYVCKYFSEAVPALLKLIVVGILTMLMLYTMTVLITVCCGSIFEAITYTILVNAVIPGTIILMLYNVYNNLYGVSFQSSILAPLTFTSVVGGFYYLEIWIAQSFEYTGLLQPWLWAALFILMTAIYGAAAFFLYKKRRAEQVSKPFVFKLAYYIIITGAIFCIYSIYYVTETSMVSMVIVTAVCYMIFETVTNRGFRRFWLSIIKYIATILAAVGIVYVGHTSEGFGAVQKIPSLSSVSSVSLSYSGFYGDFQMGSCEFIDPENIQTIIDAHSALLKNYNEQKPNYPGGYKQMNEYYGGRFNIDTATSDNSIYIDYKLKSGKVIERHYSLLNWEAAEILSKIDLTDEYRTQKAENYKKKILSVSADIASELDNDNDRVYASSVRGCYVSNVTLAYSGEEISPTVLYRRGFFEQLAEAYSNDIMSINEENYYHSNLKNLYYLHINSFIRGTSYVLDVPESFSNTLGVLERFGFEIPRVEDFSDDELCQRLINTMASGNLNLFDENQWRDLRNVPQGELLHSAYGRYAFTPEDEVRVFLYEADGNICDLIRAAEPRNIISSGCYTIKVFSVTGVIPPELTALAQTAASKATGRDYAAESKYSEIANWD